MTMKGRSKTQKPRKSRKSLKLFSKHFKSEFSILADFGPTAKIKNWEIKLGIIFPRFPNFPSFRFVIFSFFKRKFFQYSKVQKQPFVHVLENTCS